MLFCHEKSIDYIDINNKKFLFVTGSSDKTIKIWNLVTKNRLSVLRGHKGKVCKVSFHHKYSILFSGSNDLSIKCWDLEYNKNNRNYLGHFGPITSIVYHPTMDIFYSGSKDSTIRIWDMRTEKAIRVINFHSKEITSLIGGGESPHLISSSLDKQVIFFDFISGKKIRQIKNNDEIRELFDFPGNFFFSGIGKNSIFLIRKDGVIMFKYKNLSKNNKFFTFKETKEFSVSSTDDVIKTYNLKKKDQIIEFSLNSSLIKKESLFGISSLVYEKKKGNLFVGRENGSLNIFEKKWENL